MFNISIYIDSEKVRKLEISIVLQKLYYHPSEYQRTTKNLFEATKQAGFDFTLVEVEEWLEKQLLYLIYKARPKYIPCVSFNTIIVPMEVIQADILYMPYDRVEDLLQCNKVGSITYIFCLTCIDVASRYKWAEPIGTTLDIINMNEPSLE
ncbi:16226_t:CDS:1, partial [Cetraspora pellucida]